MSTDSEGISSRERRDTIKEMLLEHDSVTVRGDGHPEYVGKTIKRGAEHVLRAPDDRVLASFLFAILAIDVERVRLRADLRAQTPGDGLKFQRFPHVGEGMAVAAWPCNPHHLSGRLHLR